MSMDYVRRTYGVPAKRGMRVDAYYMSVDGWRRAKSGRITSATHHIFVDGIPFHPTWGIVYLNDDGSVIKDCRFPVDETEGGG